jgi:hypothetical protein
MYYDEMLETAVDPDVLSDSRSIPTKKNNAKTIVQREDKLYEKYTKTVNTTWKDGKYYHKVVIENYGSGQQGSKIRNAVTGQRYPYLVGSSNEDLFFKVSDASARNKRKDTLILFYDSPEQYENHHFTTISQDIKNRWQEKNMDARRSLLVY